MGTVAVAALAASRRRGASRCRDHSDLSADQFARQCRQSIQLIVGPAILDRHVLTLDKAGLLQALAESALAFR
jgi:hypothetical protein